MVLRDSKQDKETFDETVQTQEQPQHNVSNIKALTLLSNDQQQSSNFRIEKIQQKDDTVIHISSGDNSNKEQQRDISNEASEASTSDFTNLLDDSEEKDSLSVEKLPSRNQTSENAPQRGILIVDPAIIRKKKTPSPNSNRRIANNDLRSMLFKSKDDQPEVAIVEVSRKSTSGSREVSPMQQKILLEQNWQNNLSKIDRLLSDASAFHKGHFQVKLFCETFTDTNVLHLLFQLFDWNCKGRITQEKLVAFSRKTLLGHGGLEWVELLEVLAYVVCEGDDGEVTSDLFRKIFTSKGVVRKLFKYITKLEDGDGSVSRQQIMDLIANLTYARPRKGYNHDNLEWLEKLFRESLGTKQELSFEDFKKIVHSRNSFFAERVFEIFDRDKSGSVSLSEFLDAMHQFTGKSHNDKIQFLFRVYDVDGDGLIQRHELEQVMKACMEENGMKFSHEQIEDLTLALFEDADTEQRGAITYEALKAQLEKHPGLLENLSISIDRWLVPPEPQVKQQSLIENLKSLRPYQLTWPYWKNNYVYLFFLFSYILVNLGLFISRAYKFRESNVLYILARASGQCLNFNCSFILVLMLRQCITFLRARGASSFLPLDHHLYLHKLVGWVIFFHSTLHTVMHLINFPMNVHSIYEPYNITTTAAEALFTRNPGLFGLVPGWANPTGFILMILLIIMVICSLSFVRQSGYFEVFYFTHLLYVVFWILTILHGPSFWKWFIGPAVLFLIEKVYRVCRVKTGHGKTYISSGILLPSKVIHLVIQKPYNFSYHPGDYVFVNIPTIAKYEWHPFTISSAPEQDGAIWLHIRAVGEWTNRIFKYFETQQLQCERRITTKLSMQNIENTMALEYEIEARSLFENGNKRNCSTRKNGIINVTYENNEGDESNINKTEEIGKEDSNNDKKKLKDTVTLLEAGQNLIDHAGAKRTASNVTTSSDRNSIGVNESKLLFKSNRSAAKSVRYMRVKPKVVTLDMPAEASIDEELSEEQDNVDSNQQSGNTLSIKIDEDPNPRAVRRGSGRFFDRKVSRVTNQAKKSRKESQVEIARRISRLKEAEAFGQCTVGKPLAIYVDGPYGAPSSHIFRAQHAVLIATGIGVTPFASILQSIMNRYLKARQMCPNCDHTWTSDIPQSVMNLRKVDFVWINRDQRSFEWFVNLLSQLEIEQAEQGGVLERFLDMHMYITSALQRTDMKAVGLQLALELLHEKDKRDLITGLKTRTNAGRPNWDKVFKQLINQRKGKITVFYCGPPALGRTLRYKCDEYGFDFRKEIF